MKDLYDVASAAGNLEAVLAVHLPESQRQRAGGSETERSRQTRLGTALRRLAGQVYAGFQVEPVGVDRSGRQVYRLTHSRVAVCKVKEYKACCWDKGFEWVEDEAGTVYKSTPMTPEVQEALEQLRQAFIAEHGREPGPDDLLFPDMPHPEHLEAMMVEAMKAAGLDRAFIYAFEKTGLLVTEENQHLISGKRPGRVGCRHRGVREEAAQAGWMTPGKVGAIVHTLA